MHTHHTHTHLMPAYPGCPGSKAVKRSLLLLLLSGTTRVSRYQKGKTNLDFTGARDSEWQWHQLGHMQVGTSLQTDNHASTTPLKFFTGRMPFLPPNQQRQSTEGKLRCSSLKNITGICRYQTLPLIWCWPLVGEFKYCRGVKSWRPLLSYLEYMPFCVTYSRPLCTSVASSTKPELHNVSQRPQGRTVQRPHALNR